MEERFYYLNREPSKDGFRYVHAYECELKPAPLYQIKLGFFRNSQEILKEAHKYYAKVALCQDCCPIKDEVTTHAFLYHQNKQLKSSLN